jgi:hypothetical protein
VKKISRGGPRLVKIEKVAWQEVYFIVANPEGLLKMLPLGGPSLFGCRS